ncbi:DUF2281 domain-containing protein [Fibrella sp. WM1]|uniref:DUF2281 domain-containing protein n=1 Tax=Fibrella musci TaxID=3242485 RepID=UPI00352032B6
MELTVQIGFAQLLDAIRKLPPEQRKDIQSALEKDALQPVMTERKFGTLKGVVTYLADDFDAPLEDFSGYM